MASAARSNVKIAKPLTLWPDKAAASSIAAVAARLSRKLRRAFYDMMREAGEVLARSEEALLAVQEKKLLLTQAFNGKRDVCRQVMSWVRQKRRLQKVNTVSARVCDVPARMKPETSASVESGCACARLKSDCHWARVTASGLTCDT